MLKHLLTLFYPSFCNFCNVLIPQDSIFCEDCAKAIKPVVSIRLAITAKQFLKVFAVSDYKQPLRSLILKKSRSSNCLASKQLAQIILEKTPIKNIDIDYIIPIPLHWTRYARRGYNQSYVMAKVLSKNLNIPTLTFLRRKKRTGFQSKLPFKQRQLNVKGVFDVGFKYMFLDKNLLKGKNVLLVDDLCTTGATLKNAARMLHNFKPKSITAVVACRVA